MAVKRLKIILERCSGCRICELTCSMVHHGGSFNPRNSLIRIEINRMPEIDTPIAQIDKPNVCLQCEPAPCAESCPANAFQWDERLEIWEIDSGLCTGCGICANECQHDMILIKNDKAMKCDLCGGDPVCVHYCPTDALIFES